MRVFLPAYDGPPGLWSDGPRRSVYHPGAACQRWTALIARLFRSGAMAMDSLATRLAATPPDAGRNSLPPLARHVRMERVGAWPNERFLEGRHGHRAHRTGVESVARQLGMSNQTARHRNPGCGPVGRAPRSGRGGPGFKSPHPDHSSLSSVGASFFPRGDEPHRLMVLYILGERHPPPGSWGSGSSRASRTRPFLCRYCQNLEWTS